MSLVIGTWHRMAFYEPATDEKVKQKNLNAPLTTYSKVNQ